MRSAGPAIFESQLSTLVLIHRGKVRDIYRIDDDSLLFLASDRLSAFDVILPDPMPGKGVLLTAISNFWFARTEKLVANHITDRRLEDLQLNEADYAQTRGRAVIVRKLQPLPVEAIVRGYLAGTAWQAYQRTGEVCGITLPRGLAQAEELPEPVFTPSSKAAAGRHDEPISFKALTSLIGRDRAEQIRQLSLAIYRLGRDHARAQGIIIADTKFEFATDAAGRLYLADEVLTPDSSRLWPVAEYQTGISPPSFDKQYVRDYLHTLAWDKTAPAPALPAEVIANTQAKYQQAHDHLLG